jgi:hypothetical protein
VCFFNLDFPSFEQDFNEQVARLRKEMEMAGGTDLPMLGGQQPSEVVASCPEKMVRIPSMENLLACLEKDPSNCTPEEIRDVTFFYKVALSIVEKTIKNKHLMVKQNDVWQVLETPLRWASSMAYSMTLVVKMSNLENIIHNTTAEGTKKKKGKFVTKQTEDEITDYYYNTTEIFNAMRQGGKKERFTKRIQFMKWEKKVGILAESEDSNAKKRPSVEPLKESNKKNRLNLPDSKPIMGMDERKHLSEEGCQQEKDESAEFWQSNSKSFAI